MTLKRMQVSLHSYRAFASYVACKIDLHSTETMHDAIVGCASASASLSRDESCNLMETGTEQVHLFRIYISSFDKGCSIMAVRYSFCLDCAVHSAMFLHASPKMPFSQCLICISLALNIKEQESKMAGRFPMRDKSSIYALHVLWGYPSSLEAGEPLSQPHKRPAAPSLEPSTPRDLGHLLGGDV